MVEVNKSTSTGSLALGLLSGLLVGAGATYFFADEKKRKVIKKTFSDISTAVQNNVKELGKNAPQLEASLKKTAAKAEKKVAETTNELTKTKEEPYNGRMVH